MKDVFSVAQERVRSRFIRTKAELVGVEPGQIFKMTREAFGNDFLQEFAKSR